MASSSEEKSFTGATGPKISSFSMRAFSGMFFSTVGS
jgi:hypothetical protein